MTIPVGLAELASTMERHPFGYLLTVGEDGRPHAVAVQPAWQGDELEAEVGDRTGANAAARPAVSLVFPPAEVGGYSLIVDAEASPGGQGVARLRPVKAVLHRPAPAPAGASDGSCGNDCRPVPLGPA